MKQTALITGGNRGLGLQTAKELAGRGYRVFVGVRSEQAGEEAVRALDGAAEFLVIDVADSASIKRAAETLGEQIDHLDVLVNNAGRSILTRGFRFSTARANSWSKLFRRIRLGRSWPCRPCCRCCENRLAGGL